MAAKRFFALLRMTTFLFFLLCIFSSPLFAEVQTSQTSWIDQVKEIQLSNGIKFLIYPRGEAPIFSAYLRFKVGGLEEEMGKTGLAHFLEHMAFKGTTEFGTKDFKKEKPILDEIARVGEILSQEYRKGAAAHSAKIKELREKLKQLHTEEEKYLVKEDISRRFTENGGDNLNATTSKDLTSYFVSLPADKLEFWAHMESERIFKPIFREFYEEKDVVLEERRMRVDNDPSGRLYEAFVGKAFELSPYQHPTIGYENDIQGLTVRDLEEFWKRYYRPSRMVGVLVGKVDPEAARKILEKTFGKIRFDADETLSKISDEPPQKEEKRVVLHLKARPYLIMGYHKPTLPHDDDYLFDLLSQILGEGRSSRLYRQLVLEKKLAADVGTSTGTPGSRLSNLMLIEAAPVGNHSPEALVKAIDEEIDKIRKEGVTPRELQKAKNQLSADVLWHLKTNEGMASQLSYFEMIAGSWKYLATYVDRLNQFTPQDIQRAANQYLQPSNRTLGILETEK